jgi:hypothetical protein
VEENRKKLILEEIKLLDFQERINAGNQTNETY